MHCLGYCALHGYMFKTRQTALICYSSISTFPFNQLSGFCFSNDLLCRMLLKLTTKDLKFEFSIFSNNDS